MPEDGIEQPIQKVQAKAFPKLNSEAKELYRVGHETDGILSRQGGEESMGQYTARRIRWWKKLKSMDDANDELTNSETPVVALLKLPFKLSPVTITKEILEEGSDAFQPPTEIKRRKTSKNKELKRLENFNPDVLERRRTRSDAVAGI